jgi:signal transduction histidine kinase
MADEEPKSGPRRGELERELNYYRREYNDLGARVLRLQEEQSRAFREARRSRTVAKLIREAYRLVDRASATNEIGTLMLEIILDNAMCDRAAILRQLPSDGHFAITHTLGFGHEPAPVTVVVPSAPVFFFSTSQTRMEPPAYQLSGILRLPYVLWAFDPSSGYAMIIGNRSEGNVSRPFERGDQELIEGALSVYADIVYRKQVEGDLRAAKREADEARAGQATFLASLSHELRTPLNAIIGFSEVIRDGLLGSPAMAKYTEYAADIHDSGHHLLSLINDILDLSRMEKGEIVLYEEKVDLIDIITATMNSMKPLAEKKGLSLAAAINQKLPRVRADPRRLRQILTNLLGNAIKFTPPGGRVEVRATANAGQGLVLEVEDTGIGIAPQDIPKALKPFRQLDNVYSRLYSGSGLGLPICKSLIEHHGGRLELRSQLDHGTTVTIELPAERILEG